MTKLATTHDDEDYAAHVAHRWDQVRPGTASTELLIANRLERIATLHDQALLDALRPFNHHGVRNMEDFRLLALLRRENDGLTATQASRSLLISKAATSARSDRLGEAGLLQRSASDHDRRATPLRLTPTGVELVDLCLVALMEVRTSLLKDLTTQEADELANTLLKIVSRQHKGTR